MKPTAPLRYLLALVGSSLLAMSYNHAATIANWKELNPAAPVTVTTNMNTNSPTIGDGTAENADDAWVAGRFGTVATPASVTLAVGQTLTVTGSVILTGGVSVSAENNLRIGVYDESGQFDTNGTTWANGGWIARAGSNALDGLYQARTDGAFISTNPNAVELADTALVSGAFDADGTAAYALTFSITRDSATTVDLFASFIGGDGNYSATYTMDNQASTLATYNAVGLLFGGTMNLDQATLSNFQYNVVPEPSSAVLVGIFTLAGLMRRRR